MTEQDNKASTDLKYTFYTRNVLDKMLYCGGLFYHVASLLSYILWGASSCSVISTV